MIPVVSYSYAKTHNQKVGRKINKTCYIQEQTRMNYLFIALCMDLWYEIVIYNYIEIVYLELSKDKWKYI